jgi:1,4-dihydroxy-2-naphthoate octaprenyltransferase
VLNINNMRDYKNDKTHGKNTLVVKLGLKTAFIYHTFLIVGAFLCLSAFLWLKQCSWHTWLFWLLFPLFLMDLITIRKALTTGVPDKLLPKQVVQTFLLTLVFSALLLL